MAATILGPARNRQRGSECSRLGPPVPRTEAAGWPPLDFGAYLSEAVIVGVVHEMKAEPGSDDPVTAQTADADLSVRLVVVPPVSEMPTAREVIHAALAGSVEAYFRHLPDARAGQRSEGVHQARVALRRLRSDLRTFGPLLEQSWAAALSGDVRWMGNRLGEVRDADVRIEVLGRLVDEESLIETGEAAALIDEMRAQRDGAHARLLTALESERCVELHDRLLEAVADPRTAPQADDPAEENIPALMGRPWRKLKQAVAQCGPEPSDADFHAIRIRAKRCRYAAEAVEPVLGKPARRMAKAMRRLQDALGDLNDATVIRGHLADTVARHGDVGFVAGELSGLLIARAGHCAADFERLWDLTEGLELPTRASR